MYNGYPLCLGFHDIFSSWQVFNYFLINHSLKNQYYGKNPWLGIFVYNSKVKSQHCQGGN